MQQTVEIASGRLLSVVDPLSLRVEDASGSTLSTTVSSNWLKTVAANAPSSTSIVAFLLLNIVCADSVLVLPDLSRCKAILGTIHLDKEKNMTGCYTKQ